MTAGPGSVPRSRAWGALLAALVGAVTALDGGHARAGNEDEFFVGSGSRLGDGVLSLGADVQAPLRDADAGVRRRTTLNGRLGYVRRVAPGMSLGAGVFSDRAAEELGDGPVQAVFDYYGATAGLEIDDLHRLATGEEADSLVFSTVFALRYAYGSGDARWVRVRAQPDGTLSFDPVPGDSHVHELGLHVGSALHF